jgi:predicted metalloprotease with PDZ domain
MIRRLVWRTAVAAVLCAASLPAALAGNDAPLLSVTLAPAAPDAQGNVPQVDVAITAEAVKVAAGAPLLRLALVSSNVESVANTLTGLQVSDDKGALALTAHDDPETGPQPFRHWVADRAVNGTLTIRYRVPITNALNSRGAAPPFELRTEDGAFSGYGGIFLVLPETDAPYRLALDWKLPAGAAALSSLGSGDVRLDVAGPVSRFAESFFMGGAIHHYPEIFPARGFMSAWQGSPPFDTTELMRWTNTLYGSYEKFFRTTDTPPYAVFLRRNLINAGGGVEVGRSFVGTFDTKTDPQEFKLTLAHEMVHTFAGTLDGAQELDGSWFSEGIAVYYERLLPWRAGLISADAFLSDLNKTAGRYYTDLLNDTPNDQIPARFWAETRVRVLPYDRGSLYFAKVDSEVRKASGGKRSLDDLILAMLARRRQGLPADKAAWVGLVTHELGDAGKTEFDAMLSGALVLPDSDAFGACFRRTTAPLRRYELGFDSKVLIEPKRIVRGLVAGSAAERAGVRNGDAIIKPVPQDGVQADQQATLTLLIRRGDQTLSITYRPRGETVAAYQWQRTSSDRCVPY